ncbi:hypothetical protein C8R47DRAFT_1258139 [Mycena vitilis]|nr:hypothetical protein C8R47DRAFT_1258139 [Mycena vitilis]
MEVVTTLTDFRVSDGRYLIAKRCADRGPASVLTATDGRGQSSLPHPPLAAANGPPPSCTAAHERRVAPAPPPQRAGQHFLDSYGPQDEPRKDPRRQKEKEKEAEDANALKKDADRVPVGETVSKYGRGKRWKIMGGNMRVEGGGRSGMAAAKGSTNLRPAQRAQGKTLVRSYRMGIEGLVGKHLKAVAWIAPSRKGFGSFRFLASLIVLAWALHDDRERRREVGNNSIKSSLS